MLFRNSLVVIVALMLKAQLSNGANILFLSPVTSPSHHIWNSALINALAARGHNVTVLSPDEDKNPPKGVHYIVIEGMYTKKYQEIMNGLLTLKEEMNPLTEPYHLIDFEHSLCEISVETNGFQTLLNYPDDFKVDLVLSDFSLGSCLLGFVHKFKNPPLISVSAYNHPSYLTSLIGGHQYYSYVPHNYLNYRSDMNLFQRFHNFAVYMIERYWHNVANEKFDKLLEGKFGADLPRIDELEQRTALAFVNTNPAMDYKISLPENVIAVGGMHIKNNTKPLPKDLEDFIASSKKGAVLFSLGSNVQSSAIDKEKQKMFLDAFEHFPDYHFLWKFEKTSIDLRLPKNVIIRQWLPQSDILAHPKIRAFFTHSGLLSTHETVWRGIPILGMPFGYDQDGNLFKSIQNGIAEEVDFQTMTTEIIKEKLGKILEDPKYYANAKKLSARFRDQKETPLERAVWWVEWLLRNPDCDYLKSPVLRLGFIVGNSYDIIAIISITIFVILVSLLVLIIKICLPKSHKVVTTQNHHKKSQ